MLICHALTLAALNIGRIASAAEPPPSAGHALVYHDSVGAVVLVNAGLGGVSSPPANTRTVLWKWTGQQWTPLDSAGPPVRNLGGVAYDSRRDVLVLFGGSYSQDVVYDETWEWSHRRGWTKHSVTGPGKRDHTDMVYDKERGVVVLFGGQIGTDSFPADTWTWDGRAWTRVSAAGPSGRVHHSMTYDPIQRRVLLFGGVTPGRGQHGDTWAWAGSEWVSAAGPVMPRSHARLGVTSGGVIAFGGIPVRPNVALQWRDGRWSLPEFSAAPSARYLTAMAFDSARNVTVLFGGGDPASDQLFADTWEYSAPAWRKVR